MRVNWDNDFIWLLLRRKYANEWQKAKVLHVRHCFLNANANVYISIGCESEFRSHNSIFIIELSESRPDEIVYEWTVRKTTASADQLTQVNFCLISHMAATTNELRTIDHSVSDAQMPTRHRRPTNEYCNRRCIISFRKRLNVVGSCRIHCRNSKSEIAITVVIYSK